MKSQDLISVTASARNLGSPVYRFNVSVPVRFLEQVFQRDSGMLDLPSSPEAVTDTKHMFFSGIMKWLLETALCSYFSQYISEFKVNDLTVQDSSLILPDGEVIDSDI